MVIILPPDRRYAEIAESFGPLAEGLGFLAGSKIGQIRTRNAYIQAGMPRNQAEALARMPRAQQQQAYQQFVEREGFKEQQQEAPAFQPEQFQQKAPQQPFQMQPQTGLQSMQMAPQMIKQRQIPALQGAQLGSLAAPQYQQVLASGRPQEQLQAAQSGIQALQRAQQAGALGYQPQAQQLAQQQMQPPRQPGQAPAPYTPTGAPIQLPSEGPQIQPRAPMGQVPAVPVNPLVGPSPRLRAQMEREAREKRKLELAEKTFEHKVSKEERAFEHAKEIEANQQTKEYYDQIINQHKGAQETKIRLNKMENLLNEGKLPTAAAYRFFKSLEDVSAEKTAAVGAAAGLYLGGPLGAIGGGLLGALVKPLSSAARAIQASTNENLEQFEKLSADFVKTAKPFFGNRLTDTDLNAFMQTVPSLLLTDNGKKAVIKNIRDMINLQDLEYEAAKYIIKQNNGKRPADLSLQVQNLVDPQIDRIANNIKESINQSV